MAYINFDSNQEAMLGSDHLIAHWYWDFYDLEQASDYSWSDDPDANADYRYSTQGLTRNSNAYTFGIDPASWSGVTNRRAWVEYSGYQTPLECSFDVVDSSFAVEESDHKLVMITLAFDDGSGEEDFRQWKMVIDTIIETPTGWHVTCIDYLTYLCTCNCPSHKISESYPTSNVAEDNMAFPDIFRTAYIPLRSVWTRKDTEAPGAEKRYYFLGWSGGTAPTFTECQTPKDWPGKGTWLASGFTFTRITTTPSVGFADPYQNGTIDALEVIINDSDGDQVADSNGLFRPSGIFLDLPVKFTNTAYFSNPSDILKDYLSHIFGSIATRPNANPAVVGQIDDNDLDDIFDDWMSSDSSAASAVKLEFSGAFQYIQSAKQTLFEFMSQCNMTINQDGKVLRFEMIPHESEVTIDDPADVVQSSYENNRIHKESEFDSAYMLWCDEDTPQDQTRKILVSNNTSKTASLPSNSEIWIPFVKDSIVAQQVSAVNHQRGLAATDEVQISLMPAYCALCAGEVIRINNDRYGGDYKLLINEINYNRNGTVSISGLKFPDGLDDWQDYDFSAITDYASTTGDAWQAVTSGNSSPGAPDDPNVIKGDIVVKELGAIRAGNKRKGDFNQTRTGLIVGEDPNDSDNFKMFMDFTASLYQYFNDTDYKIRCTELIVNDQLAVGTPTVSDDMVTIKYAPVNDSAAMACIVDYDPTFTTDGAYFYQALSIDVTHEGVAGKTNSGYVRGMYATVFNGVGNVASLTGYGASYGHYTGDTGTTTSAYGIQILPYHRAGTITNSYGVFVGNPSSGGTVTNEWGVYQESTAATNYFAGDTGINDSSPSYKLEVNGTCHVTGEITAGTKTFGIDHPVVPREKLLYHAVVEGPEHGTRYRGVVRLENGIAIIDIDRETGMSPGTFAALCQDVMVTSLQNQDGFDRCRPGKIRGGRFRIICENMECSDRVSWVVSAARKDKLVKWSDMNDDDGRLNVEVVKEAPTNEDLKALEDIEVEADEEKTTSERVDVMKRKRGYLLQPECRGEKRPSRKVIHKKRRGDHGRTRDV